MRFRTCYFDKRAHIRFDTVYSAWKARREVNDQVACFLRTSINTSLLQLLSGRSILVTKVRTREEALEPCRDGRVFMIGGFLGAGTPESLVDGLIERGIGGITLICNDTAFPHVGTGKLIVNKLVGKLVSSYIGGTPETARQMHAGELEVELVPQGTLAERIRCGGAGLGGILTPTGVGTVVEQGKHKLRVAEKEYLLEEPLVADIALIKAAKADTHGNLVYRRSARNFNTVMAMAARLVVVEAEEIVDLGVLDPDEIMTPGIFVDTVTKG